MPEPLPPKPTDGPARGHFFGTAIRGGIEWYVRSHGPAAAHAAVGRLSPAARKLVDPHDSALGILGARKYSYPFVGELMRALAATIRQPEDAFLRDIVNAGVDATLNTVGRAVLRYAISPQTVASRAQELWNAFHDSGRVTISSVTDSEYVAELADWPNHDVTVCKMSMEARRRVVEKTGHKVEVRREKCVAWGHDICQFRVRWSR